ncbi:flagellar motor protein MotB [Permianibacter sp. IMCC34836]|uniref:OmpA/MotB family protein n=1 Tax=Permianibacter fluminis TaxID=2738515 RepID=UPI001552D32B|nr:flagellar motor protein MotB [Permianibacter fluminis]NQD37235.1 flagellar motor protein MotB [Permianibacter fluminis]
MNDGHKFAHLSALHQLYAIEHSEEPEENWVLSYLDVFALIATLFIVLTVLAQLKLEQQVAENQQQKKELQQSQQSVSALTEQISALTAPATDAAIAVLPATRPTSSSESLPESLTRLLAEQNWGDQIAIKAHDDYTELQIRDRVLFTSAAAELLPEGQSLLNRLVPLLGKTHGTIYIEGHTDNQPIDTPRFHSNWELAAARATNVLQFFADHGIPGARLRAVSVADTAPVASNADEAGRAQNRRVSLLIRQNESSPVQVATR